MNLKRKHKFFGIDFLKFSGLFAFFDLKNRLNVLYVKLSFAGCLPYHEDPKGFRSLTAQVLTKDTSFHWSLTASSELLSSFSR